MKKPQDSLFLFIKKMTSTEKRYFKLTSALYDQKASHKSVMLFEAIDAQKVYNEPALRKKFAAEVYLGKNFSRAKVDLQRSLLKSLRNFYATSNLEFTVRSLLAEIDILYDKGFPVKCLRHIDKIKTIATRHEEWLWYCEAIHFERRILAFQKYTDVSHQYLVQLELNEKEAQRKLENLALLRSIYEQITYQFISNAQRSKDNELLHELFRHPVLSSEAHALSVRAKVYYHHIKCFYFQDIGQKPRQAYLHVKAALQLTKSYTLETRSEVLWHMKTIHLHIGICRDLRKFGECLASVNDMKELFYGPAGALSANTGSNTLLNAYISELDLYIMTGEFGKAAALVPEIEKAIGDHSIYLPEEENIALLFNEAYGYFGAGDYHKALKSLNRLINETSSIMRPDIHCMARLFNLVIHYELGNEELMETLIKSTYGYIYKRKRLFKLEEAILSFIRDKLVFVHNRKELLAAFRELRDTLQVICSDAFERKALEYFDFISWLDSKLEKRPFNVIVKELRNGDR